jgi:hypothetical protein
MDLSEARGLVLFRVVRRGIGISRRLSAIALIRLQDLPSHTVCFQNIGRRPAGARCKYDHVFRKFERPRPGDHLLLTRLALQSPMGALNRAVALSDCTQPARKLGAATMQENPPFAKLSHLGQRSQSRKERDTSAAYRVRHETLRVDANQHISALLPNVLKSQRPSNTRHPRE